MIDTNTEKLWDTIWTDRQREALRSLPGPILVIGSSGFVGSKLFFNMSGLREDVYAASRDPFADWRMRKLPRFVDRAKILDLDITDFERTQELLEKLKPKTVFNLSAYGAYERQKDVAQIHQVNYFGVLNLIRILQKTGCEAFVQAGSSSEYGLNCSGPTEDSPLQPNSDYAVSKGAASLLIAYYGKIQAFPCANLRLYSIYGPFEESDRLIPRIVEAGLRQSYPPLVNGEISRDFVYVDDAAFAFVLAAATVCRTEPGLSLNIGTGRKLRLGDVAKIAQKTFSIPADPTHGSMPKRKWDLSDWYADCSLTDKKLSWRPRVDFETGLQRTKEWAIAAQPVLAMWNPSV